MTWKNMKFSVSASRGDVFKGVDNNNKNIKIHYL